MLVQEFVKNFSEKKIINTKINDHAVSDYLKNELKIKTYIPFMEKRRIAEMIVEQNIIEENGVKKYNSIDGYVALIIASIVAHTSLEFSDNPITDYDVLAESGLLVEILAEFETSHSEIDLMLHMIVDMELEYNDVGAILSRFLSKVSDELDGISGALKSNIENLDLQKILGSNFKQEDLAKLFRLLDKLK